MASRPIQSQANGFLSLLNLKNLGRLPDTLPDVVQPVLDMLPWYASSTATWSQDVASTAPFIQGNPTSIAWSGAIQLVVPQDRVWVILGGSFWADVAGGDTFEVEAHLIARTGGTNLRHTGPTLRLSAAALPEDVQEHVSIDGPFILQGGHALVAYVQRRLGASTCVLNANVSYLDLAA